MAYRSELERCCAEIEAARGAVAAAMEKYSSGGNLRAVNEANQELATARARYRECSGGNVPDRR